MFFLTKRKQQQNVLFQSYNRSRHHFVLNFKRKRSTERFNSSMQIRYPMTIGHWSFCELHDPTWARAIKSEIKLSESEGSLWLLCTIKCFFSVQKYQFFFVLELLIFRKIRFQKNVSEIWLARKRFLTICLCRHGHGVIVVCLTLPEPHYAA